MLFKKKNIRVCTISPSFYEKTEPPGSVEHKADSVEHKVRKEETINAYN